MTFSQPNYGPIPAKHGEPTLHGGKGAGLLDMTLAGLPVPEALILTTDCWKFYQTHGHLPEDAMVSIADHVDAFPESMFSVRSGAPLSMPGMMDTVLNVGVTDELDDMYPGAYRRFATSWLNIVKGVPHKKIEDLTQSITKRVTFTDMNADPAQIPARYRALLSGVIQSAEQVVIPGDRLEQIYECVEAVFKSWNTPRAKAYRKMHNISEDMGTGCVIQRMVMGTAKGLSGSGVMFSRDPATGHNAMKGEIAFNAQGEEVVSGAVTPLSLDELAHSGNPQWEDLHSKLGSLCTQLEAHFGDVQDIEFTVESGHLYVLQTRTAKMSALARIVTACAIANQSDDAQARLAYLKARIDRGMIAKTMVPKVDTDQAPAMTGLAAAPGAISGKVVWAHTALANVTKDCILVAKETMPEDFPVMARSGGILTKTGGFTCHSAVVARGIGVPAVVGCDALEFTQQVQGGSVMIGGALIAEGDMITIDGTTGQVFIGSHDVKKAQPPREIYDTLHQIVWQEGANIPAETYYYDCGIGQRVVLPIDPADPARLERQLERAFNLKAKDKTVALALELQGMGEDMFDPTPAAIFDKLAQDYGPDFAGHHILYGVPKTMKAYVEAALNVTANVDEEISVLDLLDLLGSTA